MIKNSIIGVVGTALVVLVVVLLLNVTGFKITRNEEMSVSGVLTEIKQISQLNTVEMYFNEILDYSESLSFGGIALPFTEKKFIFVIKAKVQSGIDLSTLTEEDIIINDKVITLTLDRAAITSKEILEYKAYSEKDGLFNPVSSEDTLKTLNEFLVKLDNQAIESGILSKAEENAKTVLSGFLKLIGFEEVIIEFK